MNVLFQQLYGMASISAMNAKIDEQLQQHQSPLDRVLLQRLRECDDLEEREAMIANRLGYLEQALYRMTCVRQQRGQPDTTEPYSDFLE